MVRLEIRVVSLVLIYITTQTVPMGMGTVGTWYMRQMEALGIWVHDACAAGVGVDLNFERPRARN